MENDKQPHEEAAPRRYAAFISYRHLSPDQEIAHALHKMLEHNQVRPNRRVPRNIRPVFLDTGELPTLVSLDAGILQALEQSDCLFVVCSPNLPLSKYCMREIEYFKKLHGGRLSRVYTILADGDPASAFPEILRKEMRPVQGEDGMEREEEAEVEPLFADVRAPTLRQSIKKLKKTEYLRLAAAYYGCSYDALYKRHRRWLWKAAGAAAAGAALVAAGFGAYAYYAGVRYDAAKASAYAVYTEEQTQAGQELLAITLAQEGWKEAVNSRSERYMTALRSAAVQHEYRKKALPVEKVMEVTFESEVYDSVFYLSRDGRRAVAYSDNVLQINDVDTGEILQRVPMDVARLPGKTPAKYVTISAEADENGVLWDTVSLWSIEENRRLGSYPFRLSRRENPDYSLVTVVETDAVYTIMDGQEMVAFMTSEGQPLTREAAARLMLDTAEPVKAPDVPFYVTPGNRLKKQGYLVKNQAGDVLLTLETNQAVTAFSPDWAYFGCVENGILRVFETGQWTLLAQWEWNREGLWNLYLLQNAPYALLSDRDAEGVWITRLMDWRTGNVLAKETGYAYVSNTDNSFYCAANGSWARYVYHDADTEMARVLLQRGGSCLALNDGGVRLIDTEKEETLLWAEGAGKSDVLAADDLSRVLVKSENGFACYDAAGKKLWEKPASAAALSADGHTAAYLDENGAQAVNGADGAPLFSIAARELEAAGDICQLAVSREGLCAVGQKGALWFPADGGKPASLGEYDSARLYEDGLLFLQSKNAYVMDFAVWDVKTGKTAYQPTDNTGPWAYHAGSGYLMRQKETSGNHETWEMEWLRRKDGAFESLGTITLPGLTVDDLHLDSAGEYVSCSASGITRVYRLRDQRLTLSAEAPLFYEAGAFRSSLLWGEKQYTAPFLEGQALRSFAVDMITGDGGVRTLTEEEEARYSFSQ